MIYLRWMQHFLFQQYVPYHTLYLLTSDICASCSLYRGEWITGFIADVWPVADNAHWCVGFSHSSPALFFRVDDGTCYSMVSTPSSWNRAMLHRSIALSFSSPAQKKKGYRLVSFLFYGKGTISWYNAQLQGWMHHLTSGSQGNTCLIFFLAICSLQYTKLNSPQISISSTANMARSFRHREIGS